MTDAPNIFLVNPSSGPEDRFTAHWSYLLHCHPELGQRVLDRIAEWGGLPPSEYVDSADHPWFTAESRPDFVIRSRDYDVLCEHKLDAQLGPSQLERYCELARAAAKPAHVVLVGKAPITIGEGVLALPEYRAPVHRPRRGDYSPHFLWEDLYDLVDTVPTRLARDFTTYMSRLGLEPWTWSVIGDPFTDEDAKAQFRRLWRDILPRLKRKGSLVKQDPVGTGFQYQRPMRGVRLIYVGLKRVIDPPADPRVPGRAMVARVWQSQEEVDDARFSLVETEGGVESGSAGVDIRRRSPCKSGDIGVLAREYYTPLNALMRESPTDCIMTIRAWLDAVMSDIERALLVLDSTV